MIEGQTLRLRGEPWELVQKQVFRMAENHGLKVKPGYKSFVADQGVVRFDVPGEWIFTPDTNSFTFNDRQPPDDTCALEASIFRLPGGIDWTGLSLPMLLAEATKDDDAQVMSRGKPVYLKRNGLEIGWNETRLVDPTEHREACSRCCRARRSQIQLLLTLAFWPEDIERLAPVWDEVLSSLRLGEYVPPPIERGRN